MSRAAAAQVKVQFVGRATAGSSVSEPSVLGGNLIAWSQHGATSALVLKGVTDAGVKAIKIPVGPLNQFGPPELSVDHPRRTAGPAGRRSSGRSPFLLSSNARGDDLAGTLGTYVWSPNQRAPWTRHKVWDSFGLPDIAYDGYGGFWLIVGRTGVQVVHVPESLAMQSDAADDELYLSDRVSSRLDMGIATLEKSHTLLTAFDSAHGVWVHVGTEIGQSHDVRAFKEGAFFEAIGGYYKSALIVATHRANYATSGSMHLYGRYITIGPTGGASLTKEFKITGQEVTDASLATYLDQYVISWLNADGEIYSIDSQAEQHLGQLRKAITFPHGQWRFPAWPRGGELVAPHAWFAFAYDAQNRESFVRITHVPAG